MNTLWYVCAAFIVFTLVVLQYRADHKKIEFWDYDKAKAECSAAVKGTYFESHDSVNANWWAGCMDHSQYLFKQGKPNAL